MESVKNQSSVVERVQGQPAAASRRRWRLPAGYQARPAQMSDIEAVVAMLRELEMVQTGISSMTSELLDREWTSPNFKLDENLVLVFSDDNELVGYAELWNTDNPPVSMFCWWAEHPSFTGLGIGEYLLQWAEKTARGAIDRCPDDARVILISSSFHHYKPSLDVFERYGMRLHRHSYEMTIDLDEADLAAPVWPEGITVTTYSQTGNLRALVEAAEEAFLDHYGVVPTEPEVALQNWRHHSEKDPHMDKEMWYLAMDGDEIAGVCICRQEGYNDATTGFVNTLGVRRPWRRQGLGTAMLLHSFHEFKRRGKPAVDLGVDASSLTGATKLYEKAGMRVRYQFDSFELELRPGRDLAKREL